MKPHVNSFVRNTNRVFPAQGRYDKLRYDMNENPEGLPKGFVDSVLKEITPEFLAIYPEPDRFLRKYAEFVGVKLENLMCTNGSDMAIRYLLETFGEVGKEVVTVAPSFEMYFNNKDSHLEYFWLLKAASAFLNNKFLPNVILLYCKIATMHGNTKIPIPTGI